MRHRLPRRLRRQHGSTVGVCGASPEPAPPWGTLHVYPVGCRGRYEGTHTFLGRRERPCSSLPSSFTRREHLTTCVVQPPPACGNHVRTRDRWPAMPASKRRGNKQKSADGILLTRDNRGPSKELILDPGGEAGAPSAVLTSA